MNYQQQHAQVWFRFFLGMFVLLLLALGSLMTFAHKAWPRAKFVTAAVFVTYSGVGLHYMATRWPDIDPDDPNRYV